MPARLASAGGGGGGDLQPLRVGYEAEIVPLDRRTHLGFVLLLALAPIVCIGNTAISFL
jgi:hypothetical protein